MRLIDKVSFDNCKIKRFAQLAGAAVLAIASSSVHAGGKTDGSVGPVQSFSGNFTVPQSLGTLKGNNLFHSFSQFGIQSGESATFTTTTGSIQNVISRVTGGQPSGVYGLLKLDAVAGSRPDFFLVNPAGVVFGAGAQIDVPGSFHVSTAQQLKFGDGFVWNTTAPTASGLSVAAPESFGFLGSNSPVSVSIKNLDVALTQGSTFSIAAGSVQVDSSTIQVPEGQFRAVATGATPASVPITTLPYSNYSGPINLVNSTLFTTGVGSLSLQGGSIALQNSSVKASNGGAEAGGFIRLISTGDLALDGTSVISTADLTGVGPSIFAKSGSGLNLRGSANLVSLASANAHGGDIVVESESLELNGVFPTGILTQALPGSAGNAGKISVNVVHDISIVNGARITSDALSSGSSGSITINASNLTIDGSELGLFTGIRTNATNGGTARAAPVTINLDRDLSIIGGGTLYSRTLAMGDGGDVSVRAHSILIDGKGSSILTESRGQTVAGVWGNAGNVSIDLDGDLSIVRGGTLSSRTLAMGDGGDVSVRARAVFVAGKDSGISTESRGQTIAGVWGNAGNVTITSANDIVVQNNGAVGSFTLSTGSGGSIFLDSNSLMVDGPSSLIFTASFGPGNGGGIKINARGSTSILNGGALQSSAFASGSSGKISIYTPSLVLDGGSSILSSSVSGSTGSSGDIEIQAPQSIVVRGRSAISTFTEGSQSAPNIDINTGALRVDGQDLNSPAGVTSTAGPGSTGHADAGNINIRVDGATELIGSGAISASSFSEGDGGKVSIQTGTLTIDGNGKDKFTGIGTVLIPGSGGATGTIDVKAVGGVAILDGGQITSSATSSAAGGAISLDAKSVLIDGRGATQNTGVFSISREIGAGRGGAIVVKAGDLSIFNGGLIASSTFSSASGGTIDINVDSLIIDRQGSPLSAGILNQAELGSSGSAGTIKILAKDSLTIVNGGDISTSTFSSGAAGSIEIRSRSITLDGGTALEPSLISSAAGPTSGGQTGTLSVTAGEKLALRRGGEISIQNFSDSSADGNVLTSVSVSAPEIELNGGKITAQANGNASAGSVLVNATEKLKLEHSSITTQAQDGNGGPIQINGGIVFLTDSQITTSVDGTKNGSGGNISILGKGLVLRSGFIQANTKAQRSRGGDVNVNVGFLVPDGSHLFVGGNKIDEFRAQRAGFNVIQAAAPDGLSGTLSISNPQLDVSGTLLGLSLPGELGTLSRDFCQIGTGSSFTLFSRGELSQSPRRVFRLDE